MHGHFYPPGSEHVKITHNRFAPPSAQIISEVSMLNIENVIEVTKDFFPILTLGFFIARDTLHSPFSWKGRMMAAILSFHSWLESDKVPIIGTWLFDTYKLKIRPRLKD